MARNAKKRSKPLKLSKLGKSASPVAIKIPAPQLEDFDEFPALSDALSSKRKLSPDSSLFKVTQKEALAEEGVCVDGTTYYIQATAALCGISEAITPIALAPTFTENETAARRQFPGKAYTLYEENVEYPTVFLPKNLRQAVYDHLEEYRSYLFLPDQASWTVCDNFQIYGSMEKQSGLVQGKKDLVYISRHTGNGDFVVLRRLMTFVLRNQRAVSIASKWRSINHPNVVRMRSVTTTRAFNDSSVLFAYDFYPNAMTLECFMSSETHLLDEETIWSFITQLVSGLHAIHQAGLAARTLGEKRVLLTGLDSCTVKINCVAMPDVIEIADVPHSTYAKCFVGEHRAKYEDQQADFVALGSLVQHMIRNCSGDVSNDLTQFGKALAEGTINTMQMVLGGLGTRVFEYMALYQKQKGVLEVELSKEVENGRLFRLLYGLLEKIGRYDELFPGTENTHLLRMFKNYILSRGDVYEVISCLNKLDAGVREKVRLESYAESIVKFVTYEELRRVLEEDQPVISPFFYHLNVFNDSGLMG